MPARRKETGLGEANEGNQFESPLYLERPSAIPGAALVVIEQCGHLSSMEQPQAVTALLRYWLQQGSVREES